MTETPKVIRVTVDRDPDASNPLKEFDGQWTLYTFGDNGIISDVKDTSRFLDEDSGELLPEYQEMMDAGLLFGVGHQSQSYTIFTLYANGDVSDGIFVWEHDADDMGAKTKEDRYKDAWGGLQEYENWVNGYGYRFTIERIKSVAPDYSPGDPSHNGAFWTHVDSCGGFYAEKYLKEAVGLIVAGYPGYTVIYDGDAKDIMD